ncbi:hypothetical protein MMC18_008967 [Xylographa bjoerkii]|nr:hypothetical protein [Xylographa bjoerkii]
MATPARQLLFAVPLGLQAVGSFERIQDFLQLEDRPILAATSSSDEPEKTHVLQEKLLVLSSKLSCQGSRHALASHGKNAAFGWQAAPTINVSLQDICFTQGSFTAITGPIGCGKSTLLKGLLSETASARNISPGFPEDIAYCGQTPWIYDGTIRGNIVGESELDAPWYNDVIRSCELDFDLSRMPEGDATVVGSRGQKLSGGQRQRISIARALYAKKRNAIFDDVTNALDPRTLRAVAENVFGKDGVLRCKGTAVVFATHAGETSDPLLLQVADQIMFMNRDGEIVDCGTYEELSKRHQIGEHYKLHRPLPLAEPELQIGKEFSPGEYQTQLHTRIDDLRRQRGDWGSYIFYISSMGWLNFSLFVLGAILYVVFYALFQVWVTLWAEDTNGRHGLGYWLGLYATWTVLIALAILCTPLFFFTYLLPKSSEKLHSELLAAVMRAPFLFISRIETGSLVNRCAHTAFFKESTLAADEFERFSQDIRLCDWQLPLTIVLTLFEFLGCLASIGIAVAAVKYIAIGIPVLGAVLYFLQQFYLRTSRQLRLLEIELKAPVVSLFLDTIQGLTTIRAFGWSSAYVRKGFILLDESQKPLYLLFCVQRWLLLVLSLIVVALEVLIMGLAIVLRSSISPGLVGLAIIQVTALTEVMSDLLVQWTEMETSLGAVTRIFRFTKETPRESRLGETTTLLDEWLSSSSVTFENVSASYEPQAQGKLALDDISLFVKPGEHVGVCGRTGSGKSSLIAALLRLLPCHQGVILIDGVDIFTLDPELVRSKLNLVTQEPFLFEGTVRENAGPWEDVVSDQAIIQALERVDLWGKITSLGGLGAPLNEDSLSHGQRQLFCLVRALLRERSILILDEPTGHIDPTTNAIIQGVIREEFRDRTVIMIAHSLQSLADFDRVFVLDSGRLVEAGAPRDLLNDEGSAFRALYYAIQGETKIEET